MKNLNEIKTADEARTLAIDWQRESANTSMSWEEVYQWAEYFSKLAKKFNLTEEFTENGII